MKLKFLPQELDVMVKLVGGLMDAVRSAHPPRRVEMKPTVETQRVTLV